MSNAPKSRRTSGSAVPASWFILRTTDTSELWVLRGSDCLDYDRELFTLMMSNQAANKDWWISR